MIDGVRRVFVCLIDEKCEFGGEMIMKVLDPFEDVVTDFGRDEVLDDGVKQHGRGCKGCSSCENFFG